MSAASPPSVPPTVTPPYARTAPPPAVAASRRWLVLGIIVAALLSVGVLAMRFAPGGGLIGAGVAPAECFVVAPGDLDITLTEDGELKPQKSIEIRSEVEGQATVRFIVQESTKVQKGELLVELASDELKEKFDREQIELRTTETAHEAAVQELDITRNENASKLRKAQIDRDVAELELSQYLEGEYQKQLTGADIDIKQTEMEIERKREELEKNLTLLEKKFVTQSKIDQLKFELDKALMTLDKNKLAKQILIDYDRPKIEKQKRSALDQAIQELERETKRGESKELQAVAKAAEQKSLLEVRQARVQRLSEQLGKTKIHAEVDGIVQYPAEDMMWRSGGVITVGSKVFEGQTLLLLPDTRQMLVSTRIHEADRHHVKEGQNVQVRVPAVPDRAFTGRISKIARFADSANRWLNPQLKEHGAEILLDETDAPVSPGDSAEIKIFIETVPNVLSVPVQAVFARGPQSFVFVESGRDVRAQPVTLGRSSSSLIEVKDGLKAGARVRLHADERMLAQLPQGGPAGPQGKPPFKKRPDATAAAAAPETPPMPPSPGSQPAGDAPRPEDAETGTTTEATAADAPAAGAGDS